MVASSDATIGETDATIGETLNASVRAAACVDLCSGKRIARMVEFLASKACVNCGVDNPIVLEFHHVRSKRHGDADVSVLVTHGYGWRRVQAEIDKCIVLCANCHRIRTAGDRGHYRARDAGRVQSGDQRAPRGETPPLVSSPSAQ
jgi:hypothetical protein